MPALIHPKQGFAGPPAEPVDGAQDGAPADEPSLQVIFHRQIKQDNTHDHGQQALAGQKEHEETAQKKKGAENIFSEEEDPPDEGVLVAPGERVPLGVNKIISGQAHHQKGNKEEGTDKQKNRGAGQPPEQGLVGEDEFVQGLRQHEFRGLLSPGIQVEEAAYHVELQLFGVLMALFFEVEDGIEHDLVYNGRGQFVNGLDFLCGKIHIG